MQIARIDHMFNFTFEKTAEEIVAAARTKVRDILAKIEERGVRIKKMRDEHRVTDAVLIDIQNQMRAQNKRGEERMSYTSNSRAHGEGGVTEEVTVGAGVINFLLTEQDHLDGERAQAERLSVLIRNLRDVTVHADNGTPYVTKHRLGYDELKYLGF